MRIVSVTYVNAMEYDQPGDWIEFLQPYFGILEELAKYHEVYCVEQINYEGEYSNAGIHYMFLNFGKPVNRLPFQMHRYIKSLDPDVVMVRGLHFPIQLLLLRNSLGPHVKIFVQHHAGKPPGGFRKIIQRKADGAVNGYFFSAYAIAEEWLKERAISDRKKIHEIGMLSSFFNPVEKKMARQLTGVSGSPVYLWVGQLTSNKDPLTVVKAFLEFTKTNPGARLFISYKESYLLPQIEEILKNESGNRNAIVMVGTIPHDQIQNWYNSVDFFISGSHAESYGVALSEAMSCGCIPIVTNIPSFRKMTKNGEVGILFEPGHEKELLSALNKSMELNIESERVRVLEQFQDELSFSAISKKLNQVLDAKP